MKLKNSEVRIETSTYCNGKCIMCPRDKFTRPRQIMKTHHFKWLANQSKQMGAETISPFGFGEPLMDPEIVDKIGHCTFLGLKTFITTNASFLTVDLAHSLVDAGLSKIRFSMHGRGKDYDRVHRGFDFVETMRNIGNFIQINKTKFDSACTTAVTVIPMHGEIVEDIVEFWGAKVDEVEIWKPHNWVYGKGYRSVIPKKNTCGRVHSGPIQIQADGVMVPCCFDYDGRMKMGDTYKESILAILRGPKYEQLRTRHETGDLEGLPCEVCDQRNIEKESPLLYSSVDKSRETGKTSSTKFNLEET
jgi:hypothetical protein